MPTAHSDIKRIVLFTASTSLCSYALLRLLSQVVAPFDSSHRLVNATEPGLRWDALHFQSIALRGYRYEQQLAFQPGWQGILHALSVAVSYLGLGEDARSLNNHTLQAAFLVNLVCRIVANVILYRMTRVLFSRSMAVVSCILYAFPPAPSVLVAPYTESPFAAVSFAAIYFSLTGKYLLSAALLAMSTSLRPTGVLGCAILAAHIVFGSPVPTGKNSFATWLGRLPKAIAHCILVTVPFLAFQLYTYYSFCVPSPTRMWCSLPLPLSYSWVQRQYWNVGPFRYWRLDQLPNFLLAAPVLYFSIKGCFAYLCETAWTLASLSKPEFPIYVYQAAMLAILVFASHTQIALRLSFTDPVLWWTLAKVFLSTKGQLGGAGRAWVWWCAVWGAVSLVLWAGHYPPA